MSIAGESLLDPLDRRSILALFPSRRAASTPSAGAAGLLIVPASRLLCPLALGTNESLFTCKFGVDTSQLCLESSPLQRKACKTTTYLYLSYNITVQFQNT